MHFENLLRNIKQNLDITKAGGHVYIPFTSLGRLSEYLVGIVKSSYTIITASSGAGKSKWCRYFYVLDIINFALKHPEIKPYIIVFSLELSGEEYIADIICSFLERDFGIQLSYRELLSYSTENKMNYDILEKIENYKDWIDTFNKYVIIHTGIRNPTGIYKEVIKVIKDKLDAKLKLKVKLSDDGKTEMKYYEYDNNYFFIPIVDHISLLNTEKDDGIPMTQHQSITKMSSNYFLELKNKYQCHVVSVQQQMASKDAMEYNTAGKSIEEKLEPSKDGLGENKLTQRDCTEMIGIFSPYNSEMKTHRGYNTELFQDHYRGVRILKNRYGGVGKRSAFFFNGATGVWKELPLAKDLTDKQTNELLVKELRLDKKEKSNQKSKIRAFTFNKTKNE